MKPILLAAVLMVAIASWLLAGCAGARPKADFDPEAIDPQMSPAAETSPSQPPAKPSTEDSSALSDEEASLLEDDSGLPEDRSEEIYTVADPLEPFNRAIYVFNDKLYFWVMKPVAVGYRAVVPSPARGGVKNFFYNLTAPVRIVNNILQGKGQAAEAEWARFLYNSTVGVLGFGNPARNNPKLNPKEEDLGLTLADYGIGDGFYLMLPFLGPSTLRDSAGLVGDAFLNPVAYINPWEASLGVGAYNQLNNLSFRIGDYESLKKAAMDPYVSFRNAYIQLRQSKIRQ
ncbi:MAG: MlaA family lipoprotein [Desulfobacteraceae bacterium]|nr:MlaA family lipoprotein [Desulfobacteraceae bacterium]